MFLLSDSSLVNFADDNTVSAFGENPPEVVMKLEQDTGMCLDWLKDNQMSANPSKFHAFLPCNPADSDITSVRVADENLEIEDSVPLLGIDFDSKLDFHLHMREIIKKAAFKLYAFRRISSYLNFKTKLLVFNSFILSQLQYCPLVWYNCKKSDLNKLDRIQERALRIVYKDYNSDYASLLKKAKCPDFQTRLKRLLMIEVYKTLHDLNPPYMKDIFTVKMTNYNLRGAASLLHVPRPNTTRFGKHCLSYQGPFLWNQLPITIRESDNLNHFKSEINKYYWPSEICDCTWCNN